MGDPAKRRQAKEVLAKLIEAEAITKAQIIANALKKLNEWDLHHAYLRGAMSKEELVGALRQEKEDA